MVEERDFMSMLRQAWGRNNSLVCVGLDSELEKIPKSFRERYPSDYVKQTMFGFNKEIVDSTKDLVCAYKPNLAFYEAQGVRGIEALRETIYYIHQETDIPVILDAKKGDIGNTSKEYAKFVFEYLDVDAVTLNPLMGLDSLQPFLEYKNKGCVILCLTSNPGAKDFQHLSVSVGEQNSTPFYQIIASKVQEWSETYPNCLMVVGATYPEELAEIRKIALKTSLLVPGIGKQEGDLEKVVLNGIDEDGAGLIINSSRGIIFASNGYDFAEVACQETLKLKSAINAMRDKNRRESAISGSKEYEKEDFIVGLLKNARVIREGHFLLTNGGHSEVYVAKNLAFTDGSLTNWLGLQLAQHFILQIEEGAEIVVSPAVGAIPLGAAVAQQLTIIYHLMSYRSVPREVEFVYTEKEGDEMKLKRGFEEKTKGKKVLVVEDILTTGGTVTKNCQAVKEAGGTVVGVGALWNRNPQDVTAETLGVPHLFSLVNKYYPSYAAESCPLCNKGVPVNTDFGHGEEFLKSKK